VQFMRAVVGVGLVLGAIIGATATAAATDQEAQVDRSQGHIVTWDIVQISNGVVVPAGTDVSRDAATGDRISLAGSGQAKVAERQASGGGTFVHRHADGTLFAQGVYYVTGFVSWEPLGGSLASTGLIDGVGPADDQSSGEMALRVHLVPNGGGSGFDGVLTIHCHLPGAIRDIEEGFSLDVGSFHFAPVTDGGFTLFHILH
jgi:hypothetical protein